jgi:hypothetical protein
MSTNYCSGTDFSTNGVEAPYVCVLDTGVNRTHPLLTPLLAQADLHTVTPALGVDDQANHGTGIAGLAAYGDLTLLLTNNEQVSIAHRLDP